MKKSISEEVSWEITKRIVLFFGALIGWFSSKLIWGYYIFNLENRIFSSIEVFLGSFLIVIVAFFTSLVTVACTIWFFTGVESK